MGTSNLPTPQLKPVGDETPLEVIADSGSCCGGACCSS
jgi:hypothetical protein